MMNVLEAEALLIRHAAAITQVELTDEEGRWELLANVITPDKPLLDASLQAAEERGPSPLAHRMVGTHNTELRRRGKRVAPAPRRESPREWLAV